MGVSMVYGPMLNMAAVLYIFCSFKGGQSYSQRGEGKRLDKVGIEQKIYIFCQIVGFGNLRLRLLSDSAIAARRLA